MFLGVTSLDFDYYIGPHNSVDNEDPIILLQSPTTPPRIRIDDDSMQMHILYILIALILSTAASGEPIPEKKCENGKEVKCEASMEKGSVMCMMGGYYPYGSYGYPGYFPYPYYMYEPYGWWW
uniref:SVWC domain-containing protein n=1 Tax=Haemonchus contortus TaxID=6289 RepID=A0A7I4YIX7_HAECO